MPAHEAEALAHDVEDAARVGMAGALVVALEDGPTRSSLRSWVPVSSSRSGVSSRELGDAHLAEVGEHRGRPLAGGLEFLLLLELETGAREVAGCVGAGAKSGNAGRDRVGAWVGDSLGERGRGREPRPGWVVARNRSAAQAGLGCSDDTPRWRRRRWTRSGDRGTVHALRRSARARSSGSDAHLCAIYARAVSADPSAALYPSRMRSGRAA